MTFVITNVKLSKEMEVVQMDNDMRLIEQADAAKNIQAWLDYADAKLGGGQDG